jgi:hypothetical protein
MNGDPSAHASCSLMSKLLVTDTLSPRGELRECLPSNRGLRSAQRKSRCNIMLNN